MATGSAEDPITDGGSVLIGLKSQSRDALVNRAESLYRAGRTREALAACDQGAGSAPEHGSVVHLGILRGMALFDLGDCIGGVSQLVAAESISRAAEPDLQFAAAFALFVRQSDFQAPEDALLGLSRLRQLATIAGDARSLAGLHFAVARVEGYRGYAADAHRHLDLAQRFADRCGHGPLRCTLGVVAVSLEFMAGNLLRARLLAEESLVQARAAGFKKYVVASQANLAAVGLYLGDTRGARRIADDVLKTTAEMPYLRVGVLDTLTQLSLREEHADRTRALLDQCAETIAGQRLPARSWYDLAHQLTRCSYFESVGEWPSVLKIAENTEPELVRRQFRALRTSLLCAKARALAQLGEHHQAETTLATAVRVCPRGAIDPLIVLEASLGLCRDLAGDRTQGAVHFDRARAGCRAIGHRYRETWIDRCREATSTERRARVALAKPVADPRGTALILADVSAILGAGHSVDLLAHRLTAILGQSSLAERVRIESESGRPYRADSSAEYQAAPDGSCAIRLRGSDRRIDIHIRDVHSLEDIALLKNIVDLVQAAVGRTTGAEGEDGQQNLWPEATPTSGDDTVFQSPRMVELLRVAMRLAAAPLPILITGETGTGKELLARFIHESSPSARGPFVPFNCSAMPRDLVESQLFGHRRGAFTGAVDSFPGVIRAAEQGTLFLDEIGDLDPAVQPKLLRFLESGEVHPVGESKPHHVRVRVVAATNADLNTQVAQNRFRPDLFYRIGVAPLALPPLRERKDEIPALAGLFLNRYCRECERRNLHLGDDFIAALLLYDWPGNIRQLANEIRRVVAMSSDGETLLSSSLSPEITRLWNVRPTATDSEASVVKIRLDQSLEQATADLERRFIEHALTNAGGRVAEAAQLLGLSRKGLFLKRRRQGLMPK
jgi:transcriptional regulator with PAS, ATPase and Fis domain